MADIFISYRRDDTKGTAGRIYDRLMEHFGDSAVYLDVEGARGGEFLKRIKDEAASCKVMIIMIGETWLNSTKNGRRRLDNADDVVREECRIGLRSAVLVIPALIEDAPMPARNDLPEDIARLAGYDAVKIRHDGFKLDMRKLIEMIEPIVPRGSGKQEAQRRVPYGAVSPLDSVLPGKWQIQIVYPNGMQGASITEFTSNGIFHVEGRQPLGAFRIDGTWRVEGSSQVLLIGQASLNFLPMAYACTVSFSHVSNDNIVATMSSGEQTTWQRVR